MDNIMSTPQIILALPLGVYSWAVADVEVFSDRPNSLAAKTLSLQKMASLVHIA